MTELSNLCGLAQVRAVKKSCHAALVFSQDGAFDLQPHVEGFDLKGRKSACVLRGS